jgi:hypothetical protein
MISSVSSVFVAESRVNIQANLQRPSSGRTTLLGPEREKTRLRRDFRHVWRYRTSRTSAKLKPPPNGTLRPKVVDVFALLHILRHRTKSSGHERPEEHYYYSSGIKGFQAPLDSGPSEFDPCDLAVHGNLVYAPCAPD